VYAWNLSEKSIKAVWKITTGLYSSTILQSVLAISKAVIKS